MNKRQNNEPDGEKPRRVFSEELISYAVTQLEQFPHSPLALRQTVNQLLRGRSRVLFRVSDEENEESKAIQFFDNLWAGKKVRWIAVELFTQLPNLPEQISIEIRGINRNNTDDGCSFVVTVCEHTGRIEEVAAVNLGPATREGVSAGMQVLFPSIQTSDEELGLGLVHTALTSVRNRGALISGEQLKGIRR